MNRAMRKENLFIENANKILKMKKFYIISCKNKLSMFLNEMKTYRKSKQFH